MPEFWYFDLGNVLLFFDHHRGCRQLAQVFQRHGADTDAEAVWQALFASGLEQQYEMGRIGTEELYRRLCRQLGAWPPLEQLAQAASDIFEPNGPVITLARQLAAQGLPTGVLSNTNAVHWDWVAKRFPELPAVFRHHVLSFRAGAVKPQEAIFEQAIRTAGVPPERIFFVDDTPANVAAARGLGIDAVLYTTAEELAQALRSRGAPL